MTPRRLAASEPPPALERRAARPSPPRRSRAGRARRRRAIRASSSSSCAARSTGCPRSRRSAIPTTPTCIGELALRWDGAASGAAARRFLRPQSGDGQFRAAVRRQAGAGGPCGGDQLSRALAFRRPGRARKRHAGAGPGRQRLAQSRRRGAADGRTGRRRAARWRSARPRRWSCAARRRFSAGRPRASPRRPTISSRG